MLFIWVKISLTKKGLKEAVKHLHLSFIWSDEEFAFEVPAFESLLKFELQLLPK